MEHNRDEWFEWFEGMDEKHQQRLFDMGDVNQDTKLSRVTLGRIQRQTFDGLNLPTRARRRARTMPWTIATAAAAMMLVCLTPNPVSAALQRALSFVPGLGLSTNDTNEQTDLYVLKAPVTTTYEGYTVTIDALAISSHSIILKMTGDRSGTIDHIEFVNDKGIHYDVNGGSQFYSNNEWGAEMEYTGPVSDYQSGTIVLGDKTRMTVPVNLVKASTGNSMSALGPTSNANGVTMAAVATRIGSSIRVNLISQHGDYNILDYGLHAIMPTSAQTTVMDSNGRAYAIHPTFQADPTDEFTFDPMPAARQFHISVPEITARFNDSARVTLPVPASGVEDVSKTVTLAGYPVTFTKVELIAGSSPTLRVFVDLHDDIHSPSALYQFGLGSINGSRDFSGFSAKLNEQTGAYEYLDVPIDAIRRQVSLVFTDPDVVIRGPWNFDVKVPAGSNQP